MPDTDRSSAVTRRAFLGCLPPGLAAGGAMAQGTALRAPAGPVLLSVTGHVTRPNRGHQADFDRAMLEALPVQRVETATNWTAGVRRFEGPRVRDVLEAAGASGERVTAVALNDYTIEIPMRDFLDFDVLLAMRMDGNVLTVRNKGPLWVIYPRDRHPELRTSLYDSRWIWQLRTLQVR